MLQMPNHYKSCLNDKKRDDEGWKCNESGFRVVVHVKSFFRVILIVPI